MRIGILGSGLMGGKLGTLFARAGHDVVFSYARERGKLEALARTAGDLSGKILVTCSLPMNADDTGLVVAHTSSGAEELAKKARGARVVSAFGTVPSEVLFAVFEARDGERRPSLVYSGDDEEAKVTVASLIRDVGFDPVDAGPLAIARYSEPFTLLMARLAYEGDDGPAVAYRFERYEEGAITKFTLDA